MTANPPKKVVLAYSGGLDTSMREIISEGMSAKSRLRPGPAVNSSREFNIDSICVRPRMVTSEPSPRSRAI